MLMAQPRNLCTLPDLLSMDDGDGSPGNELLVVIVVWGGLGEPSTLIEGGSLDGPAADGVVDDGGVGVAVAVDRDLIEPAELDVGRVLGGRGRFLPAEDRE